MRWVTGTKPLQVQTWADADRTSALTIGALAVIAAPAGLALLDATDPAWT